MNLYAIHLIQGHLTENVGSCWYKAPEVILAPGQYSEAVDLWAMGCILGEMLLQRPVFAGSNEVHQLLKVIDTLHLTDADWSMVLKVMPNKLLKNQPLRPRNPLSRLLSHLDAPSEELFISKELFFWGGFLVIALVNELHYLVYLSWRDACY